MPDTGPGPLTDAGRNSSATITGAMAALHDEESDPSALSKPPSLADNRANGGQNPLNEPTSAVEPRSMFTIGNRGGD